MKNSLSILLILFTFFSCDDGDIITVEFDFEDTFKTCGDLVFYKTKDDPAESFSIQLTNPQTTLDDILAFSISNTNEAFATVDNPELTFAINGSSNRFNYRRYNTINDDYFCSDVPPAEIELLEDNESTTGTVIITTTLIEDDNDGIPAEFEDDNTDGDNDPATNPTDTDSDGIPDYLDDDDDGDNVKTSTENPNYDEVTGLANAQDTDADSIPDYLDTDDDDDGILTRDEESESQNQNPTDDITDNTVGPDYLNDQVVAEVSATAYRVHTITQNFVVIITIENISLPSITLDTFDFGQLVDNSTTNSRNLTPTF